MEHPVSFSLGVTDEAAIVLLVENVVVTGTPM